MNYIFTRPAWQLAIVSGLCVGTAYQPWHLGFLVYIGFIPLIHVWFTHNTKNNFKSGYIFGLVYNLISNYWIGTNSGAEFGVVLFSLISAVMYLALFWGIAGTITGALRKDVNLYLMLPFLVVSLEWIRSFGPLGFAWGNLALTQTDYLPILQNIDIAGTYYIAFWIISINVILYNLIYSKTGIKKVHIIPAIIFLGLFFSGWGRMQFFQSKSDSIDIAIIQPNVNPNEKWDYSSRQETLMFMDSLHNTAISLRPDFILFPETALPAYLRLNNRIRSQLQTKVDTTGIPVLVGTVDRIIDPEGKKVYYNSAMYLSPKKAYEMYEKIHLVPFAEYDLFPGLFHPLENLNLNIDRGVFQGGKDYKIFKWNQVQFSELICYESSLPRYDRQFVQNGADILMIQANDGWLGESAGPYQHFELARLRAIENRIPVVRSGNTGISGVILPTGEVQRKVPLGIALVFMENIPLYTPGSFYSHYGDVFAVISFVIFLFLGPVSCLKKQS